MDQKNLTPPLELGGPWKVRSSENPLFNIHNLAQSMASKFYLIKNKNKNANNLGVGLQPSPLALQHEYILWSLNLQERA